MKETKNFPATNETSVQHERLQTCRKLSRDRSQFPVQGDGTWEAQAGMLSWPSGSQRQSGPGGFAGPLGRPGSAEGAGRHRRGLCPGPGSHQLPPPLHSPPPPGGSPGSPRDAAQPLLGPAASSPPGWLPWAPHARPSAPRAPQPARSRAPQRCRSPLPATCRKLPAGPAPAALTRGLAGVDPVRVRQAGDGEDVGSQEEAS